MTMDQRWQDSGMGATGVFMNKKATIALVTGVGDDTVPVDRSRTFARGKRHVTLLEVDDGHELTASIGVVAAAADTFLAPLLGQGQP